MSEQLTLEGLTGSKGPKTKTKPKVSGDMKSRLEQLSAQKARIDQSLEALPPFAQFNPDLPALPIAEEPSQVAAPVVVEPKLPPPQEEAKPEPQVLTVTELNRSIKGTLERGFPMLWVKGEISNFKMPASGHFYFTLKDSGAQIRAVMFRGFTQQLKFKPQDGMEVVVRCKVTVYEPRGDYQVFCEFMEPVGFGALQVAFEQLKAKLQAEGLFDHARKRSLPAYPTRLGIVTSPTGAAIRDMLNILSRRHGSLDISIIPTSVQGDKAPGEIVKAIELANSMPEGRFDVLIVGRGGGSLEDLWAFNEEIVVRAVAASKIPTISAVGHEVDFTICDFVADLRAPTPSAAAELVVRNKADLVDRINMQKRQLVQLIARHLTVSRTHFQGLTKRLIDPKRKLQDLMLRCDEWTQRLEQTMLRHLQDLRLQIQLLGQKMGTPEKRLEMRAEQLKHLKSRLSLVSQQLLQNKNAAFRALAGLLHGLSPLAVLERGYAIVRKGESVIRSDKEVKSGDLLAIRLHEGDIKAQVLE